MIAAATISSITQSVGHPVGSFPAAIPCRRVVLENMVSIEDLNDPELKDEISQEAMNYGNLKKVDFVIESNAMMGSFVKVLLDFDLKEEAEKCYRAMNGRFFAGKAVKASLHLIS